VDYATNERARYHQRTLVNPPNKLRPEREKIWAADQVADGFTPCTRTAGDSLPPPSRLNPQALIVCAGLIELMNTGVLVWKPQKLLDLASRHPEELTSTQPFSSFYFAGLEEVDGLDELPSPPGGSGVCA
jgi:hypothetical protein